MFSPNELIFVFGSNLAGRHGKGAAKYARHKYGAVYGVGEGPTGNAYALPTKDEKIKTRSLDDIYQSILKFVEYANTNPDKHFLLTPVGCGLAGYRKADIWPLFKKAVLPDNVYLTSSWVNDYVET
jgi:hypothetical protein